MGAKQRDSIKIVSYDYDWPSRFGRLGQRLRSSLSDVAIRIDHIGSTAVLGLAAKPIIDIQISVAGLEPVDAYRPAIEILGFIWRVDNPDKTKRYFREQPGYPRTHIHVRQAGSWAEQHALLFRDYLREHPKDATEYAETKMRLAKRYQGDRQAYNDAKVPIIWDIMRNAFEWSQVIGWQPGKPDY